jgi:cytochrome c peroxidase
VRLDTLGQALLSLLPSWSQLFQGNLPSVPVPGKNPVSESKRLLGKILFCDEQLSSDDMVACGTCHIPAAGTHALRPIRDWWPAASIR